MLIPAAAWKFMLPKLIQLLWLDILWMSDISSQTMWWCTIHLESGCTIVAFVVLNSRHRRCN